MLCGLQFPQQPGNPLGVGGGIAGRMDPRGPREGGNRQAGIVGQGPAAAGQGHGGGLEAGVLRKGGARFLHLQALRLGPDLQGQIRQEGGEFADLAGVAAGDHQG